MALRLMMAAAAAVIAAGWAGPAPAASFDCAQAGTAQEKLICATPELSRLDEAVAAAYNALLGRLADPQRLAVRDSQRDWVRYRRAACPIPSRPSAELAVPPADCMARLYRARQQALADAIVTSGPYTFLTVQRFRASPTQDDALRARHPVYSTTVAAPRVIVPQGPEADAFDSWFEAWADNYMAPSDDTEADVDLAGSVTFDYAGPTLISLQIHRATYDLAAAHGAAAIDSVNWLWRQQRELVADDLFRPDSNWQPALAQAVLDRLHQQGLARDGSFRIDDAAELRGTTDDPINWIVTPAGLGIRFARYAVGPGAVGAPVVDLPWSAMNHYLVADPPLALQ